MPTVFPAVGAEVATLHPRLLGVRVYDEIPIPDLGS